MHLLRFLSALRLCAFGQRRNRALARFGQRAVKLLAPVRDISTGAIHINHVHRFIAGVRELVKQRRRHEYRLTCFDRAALRTDANLTFTLDNKINFLLFLVVPWHLAAPRLEYGIAHGKTFGGNRLAELADEAAAPTTRRKSTSRKLGEISNNHSADVLGEHRVGREPFLPSACQTTPF